MGEGGKGGRRGRRRSRRSRRRSTKRRRRQRVVGRYICVLSGGGWGMGSALHDGRRFGGGFDGDFGGQLTPEVSKQGGIHRTAPYCRESSRYAGKSDWMENLLA